MLLAVASELFLFVVPRIEAGDANAGDVIQLSLVAVVSILVCLLVDRLKRSRHANAVALRELTQSNFARDRSEHRLDAGLNAIADPILLLAPIRDGSGQVGDFAIEYQNEAAAELHEGGRASRATQLGRRLSEVGPIHVRAGLMAGYVAAVERGVPLDRELQIDLADPRAEPRPEPQRHVEVRARRLGDGVVVQWRDVSAHRQAEASYQRSEGRYRTLVRSSGAVVWTAAPDGRSVEPQPDWARFTGMTPAQISGMGAIDPVHPDDLERTHAAWRRALETGKPYVVDHRVRRFDGEYRDMSVRAVPILGRDGQIEEWFGVHTDVTERRRAEAIIADNERQLRRVLNALYCYVTVTTPDGTVMGVNDAPLRAAGLNAEDVVGRKLWDCPWWRVSEAVQTSVRNAIGEAAAGAVVRFDTPMYVVGIEGGPRTQVVDFMVSPMRDEQGVVTHLVPSAVDVSDRHRAREALAAREQRFRRLYESNLIGITFYDAAGDFEQPNAALRSILLDGDADADAGMNEQPRDATADRTYGWTRDTPAEWADVDRLQRERLMRSGRCGPYEKEFARPDGTRVPVLVAAAELDPAHPGAGGVAFVLDLTHVKRVEEALRRTESNLRAVNESLEQRIRERTAELQQRSDQLRALALDLTDTESRERKRLAQVLHDSFQQLVSAAKLKVGIVRRRLGDGGDEKLLETIRQVEGLLAETIDASRALATELSPPVLHDAGLEPALEWLGRRVEKEHGLAVAIAFEPGSEPANEQVRTILFECVRELLLNVVRHAGAGAARVEVTRPQAGLIQISVGDDGRGFDPVVAEVRPNPDGSFGLFTMRERLSLLGGLVRVRSHAGSGTTVLVTVPLTFRAGAAGASGPAAPHDSVVGMPVDGVPNVRVLVADDHRLFREGLISLIGQESFVDVVGQANDGGEAVAMARQLRPDILICDITMPVLNGIQVVQQLHGEMPELKIIGLSMHERDDMATAMRDAGAVAYCTKGGPTETLLGVLRGVAGSTSTANKAADATPTD